VPTTLPLFQAVLSQEARKAYANVERWLLECAQDGHFSKVLGAPPRWLAGRAGLGRPRWAAGQLAGAHGGPLHAAHATRASPPPPRLWRWRGRRRRLAADACRPAGTVALCQAASGWVAPAAPAAHKKDKKKAKKSDSGDGQAQQQQQQQAGGQADGQEEDPEKAAKKVRGRWRGGQKAGAGKKAGAR
jgi:hypothetical protein